MSFSNLYYKRTTATPGSCYVCCKPSTTVLATINTTDFFYTCPEHLKDPNFASELGESNDGARGARKMDLSPEEIAKVKEEWEARQKEKKEKAKDTKEKAKSDIDGSKDEGGGDKDMKEGKEMISKTVRSSATPSAPPPPPTHQRFTLHRDFFAMRLAEHRRRRQTAQARELAPRLPVVPYGNTLGPRY